MKRMNPATRRIEAFKRVFQATRNMIQMYGAWNTNKIMEDMESILREKRMSRKKVKST